MARIAVLQIDNASAVVEYSYGASQFGPASFARYDATVAGGNRLDTKSVPFNFSFVMAPDLQSIAGTAAQGGTIQMTRCSL
jgi:hypothetical protein